MKPVISCCGVECSACLYFGKDCAGCPAIEGKVFWLTYTGESVCDIYACCVGERKLAHCGLCPELPCARYEKEDPTRTPEENAETFRAQMALLAKLRDGALGEEYGHEAE